MPRETTFDVYTLPNLGSPIAKKFPLTSHISSRRYTKDYSAGGEGVLELDRDFSRLAEILHVDPTNHANDVGSLIRVSKDGTPVAHYVARRFEDNLDPVTPTTPLTLGSMDFFLDRTIVPPYDYDPAELDADNPNPTLDPDWEYGADSILRFGTSVSNEIQEIWRGSDVTMGTFTLTDGVDETDPIDWDASAATIATRLETDITAITNVQVRGNGALKTPWEVEWINPTGNIGYTLAIGTNSTDGVFSISVVRDGGNLDPSPWHKSYNPVTKTEHGNYQTFQVVDNSVAPAAAIPTGDTYVLQVDPDSVNVSQDYPGAQSIVQVNPGSTYRATIAVYAPTTARSFRLVVRDMNENLIGTSGDILVPADTLTYLSIPSMFIPEGVNEVIFRVGILETTNIGAVYMGIQSAVLAPGFAPAPLGEIFNDLLVPINTRGFLDWVVPTWTDTHDSAGVLWDRDLSWTIQHKQTILQLVEFAREWGYESSGIYWHEGNQQFQWDLYNPGGGGQILTDVTITRGDIEGSSPVLHRMPDASMAWAFGNNNAWGRYEDATLISRWGKLELGFADRQGKAELVERAREEVEAAAQSASGHRLRVRTANFATFIDMNPGDFVPVNLGPGFIAGTYRIAGITEFIDENGDEISEIHIGTLVKDAQTATVDTVRELYRKFEAIQPTVKSQVTEPAAISVGGKIPFLVAAENSPQEVRDVATYLCDGVNDEVEIQEALWAAFDTGFGQTVWLAQGEYNVTTQPGGIGLTVPDFVSLKAWAEPSDVSDGFAPAWIYESNAGDPANSVLIDVWRSAGLGALGVYAYGTNQIAVRTDDGCAVRDCYIESDYIGVQTKGVHWTIQDTLVSMFGTVNGPCIDINEGGDDDWHIRHCTLFGGSQGVRMSDSLPGIGGRWWIIDNWIFGSGYEGIRIPAGSAWQYGYTQIRGNLIQGCGQEGDSEYAAIFVEGTSSGIEPDLETDSDEGHMLIVDNIVEDVNGNPYGNGIWVKDAQFVTVARNMIENTDYHGIKVEGSSAVQVAGNSVSWPSVVAAYDGIHLTGDGYDNVVMGNQVIGVSSGIGVPWRYGVNIATAGMDGTVVVGNDLRRLGTGSTAPINDSGTGTILSYPGHATYGDNFT